MTKLYASVAAFALAAVIGGTAYWTATAESECGATAVAGATIGGPFELLDSDGTLVTDLDVIDRPSLVYFGYAFCPDVCPFDVARNALAIDILEEQGIDAKPVFITIDPARDTPEELAKYAADMHPKMVALSGSEEQVKTAAQAYKVYYAKGEGEGDFYLMDHSTFTYLMMPDTGLATFFKRDDSAEFIAEKTACLAS
jgi:protein SCO1/2